MDKLVSKTKKKAITFVINTVIERNIESLSNQSLNLTKNNTVK